MSDDSWPASVEWISGEAFLGLDGKGHSIVYDSDAEGANRGMTPMMGLLTTLGACSGMDVVDILKKRKQKLASLRVLLRGERPQFGYPKPFKSIEVKYVLSGVDIEKKSVDEAVNSSMEKFCSVAATLKPGVKIVFSYEIAST